MSKEIISFLFVLATLLLYAFFYKLYRKYQTPLLMPIIIVSFLIIIGLLVTGQTHDVYMISGQWIEFFMGPAVVALAIPLYHHLEVLKKLIVPVFIGTFVGAVTGVLSGILLAKAFGFDRELILALTPKSVTTPVAVSITETVGGPMSLAAVFVVIAGAGGALMNGLVFRVFRIKTPLGRGIGLGSASHAIGTAAALERGQKEASFSTIAMVISAVIVSFIAPLCIVIFL